MIDEQRYRALIQQLATGGITGNKTYHQYHDQFVPIDSEGAGYANGGGVGSMMKPKRGLVNEPGGYAGWEENDIFVEDLSPISTPHRIDDGFLITAAAPLKNQSGVIESAPKVMENAGVTTITNSGINSFNKPIGPVPPQAPWEGYVDLIQYPEGNPNAGNWLRTLNNIENSDFYNDTTKNMRLKGEPIIAENWNLGDIFNKDTTLTGYQKFPKGDQWNNKDKYLKSDEYLQSLEPSVSGINTNKKSFNLFDLSPTKAILEGIVGMLPEMDPRQVALRDFYGYDNKGSVPAGLMEGYNPVSGGFLNTLTGGKFGKEPTYGLQKAYDKRIGTIEKTLGNKYGLTEAQIQDIYAGTLKDEDQYNTQLIQRLRDLKAAKDNELAVLNKVKEDQAALALKEKQKNERKTSNQGGGDGRYGRGSDGQKSYDYGQGFGWSATGSGPVSNRTGRGRTDWADGGIITLKI